MMGHGGDIYRNKVELDHSVNLNPLGTPQEVTRAVRDSLDQVSVYPDPEQEAVRRAIAEIEGVSSDQVIAGNGASELLPAAVRALHPGCAFIPEPAFTGYSHALEAAGCRIERIFLHASDGFRLTGQALLPITDRAADRSDTLSAGPDLLILCDPSNPAGTNIDEKLLLSVLERTNRQGTAVILDESFSPLSDKADHTDRNRIRRLIDINDRLIVVKSFTKLFSIPGIRAGYAVSTAENIRRIRSQLPEWNLSAVSEAAVISGCLVLRDTDFAVRSRALIRDEREYLARELGRAGLTVYRSEAPYLLVQGPEYLYQALLERRILIRECGDFQGLGRGWFRIAVRNHLSNEKLINAVGTVTEERHGL